MHIIPIPVPPSLKQNLLLAALPEADYQRLFVQLEPVQLKIGQPLDGPGVSCAHAYFIVSGVVSMLYRTLDGEVSEVAVIGNEGMAGVELFMGGSAHAVVVVKSAGFAYRMREAAIQAEFRQCDSLQRVLLRYTHSLLGQIAQTAACNRHHSIDQQFCRFLLTNLDRLPSSELHMTQESIAHALGVRRESITEAAKKLQSAGLIRYSRGHITVTDREGLESGACECYAAVKREYACTHGGMAGGQGIDVKIGIGC